MQLNQRRYRDARRAESQSGAGDGIKHPCRHHDDYAGRYLDVNDLAAGAPLNTGVERDAHRVRASDNGPRQNDRAIALNRKNALFAGSDGGAEHWAVIASLIETCKLLDVEPHGYLADVITHIVNGHPQSRLDELLPWAYPATPKLRAVA
jgi:hypothetical protein